MIDGKTVLITGADGGLGNAVTRAFLDAGALVAGVSRSVKAGAISHERLLPVTADLGNAEGAQSAVDRVRERWGKVDVVAHLVGGFAGGTSVAETGLRDFDRMIDLNLRSALHLFQAVLPHMREQRSGRIIAVGSRAAVEPAPMIGVYAASKAALVSLVRTVAAENKDAGITANIVLPGTMDTPANRAAMPDADPARWVSTGQVAALMVHLASDAASQINGAVIPISGLEG